MGVAAYHVIHSQISNLSIVKEQPSTGFCPEHADVGTAFVEFSESTADLCSDHVMVVMVTA